MRPRDRVIRDISSQGQSNLTDWIANKAIEMALMKETKQCAICTDKKFMFCLLSEDWKTIVAPLNVPVIFRLRR